jgi:hypothetical protein
MRLGAKLVIKKRTDHKPMMPVSLGFRPGKQWKGPPSHAKSVRPGGLYTEEIHFQEAFMSFDLKKLREFLERILPLIERGFGGKEILEVQDMAEGMEFYIVCSI